MAHAALCQSTSCRVPKCQFLRTSHALKNVRTKAPPRTARRSLAVRALAPEVVEAATVVAYQPPELTWQVVVGAAAGFFPFIIASYIFGTRIAAQRRCQTCGGSGLQLVGRYYRRCGECGGWLPWQDWRRFFTG